MVYNTGIQSCRAKDSGEWPPFNIPAQQSESDQQIFLHSKLVLLILIYKNYLNIDTVKDGRDIEVKKKQLSN